MTGAPRPGLRRRILRLAIPALGALLAEPTFLLIDTAIVGHLGTPALAGVGVAAVILSTVVGLAVFLAYGTTAEVARSVGAGRPGRAFESGVAGLYLALVLGAALVVAGLVAAGPLVLALGASGAAADLGRRYLLVSLAGLPAMLLVLAATGVLRGLQDTRMPLVVAVAGAALNTALNLVLVRGLHFGVAGSAAGTAATQNLMAVALVVVVVRAGRRAGVSLRAHPARIAAAGLTGISLFVRTLTLRIAIVLATAIAARQGLVALAAHQVVTGIWNFLALGLDALAIAAQSLTGEALGRGDRRAARRLTATLVRWGLAAGAVAAVALLALDPLLPALFSPDVAVRVAAGGALVIVALALPLGGYVFVLDGVLIGAGDGRYLAWAGVWNLMAFLPAAAAVLLFAPDGRWGLAWLWASYVGIYLTARAVTLGVRYRRDRWLVVGADAPRR